ncbi:putative glass-like 4, partial [Homarus americanus]
TLPSMMGSMSAGSCYATGSYQDAASAYSSPAPPHVFPAMSVNVSMNMTMGVSNVNMGYSPEQSLQHQWSTSCSGPQGSSISPVGGVGYPQHSAPGLVSPLPMSYSITITLLPTQPPSLSLSVSGSCSQGYGVGSYSWSGDLRPDHHTMPSFDRDLCLRSPPIRPRPGSPCIPPYHNTTPTSQSPFSPHWLLHVVSFRRAIITYAERLTKTTQCRGRDDHVQRLQ